MAEEIAKRWLAEFVLRTNLRVTPDKDLRQTTVGGAEVYFSNVPYEEGSGTYWLLLRLIFEAESLQQARDVSSDLAEECTYALGFVSGASVRVDHPVYVIDWRPGVKDREMIVFSKHPLNDPLDALDDRMLRSVAAVSGMEVSHSAKAAMRWSARAARATIQEDQYLYYFFAIEVLAAAEQMGALTPKCPRCRQDLVCSNPECGHPEHRPYPSEKIALLLETLGVPEKLARAAVKLRHLISHGEEREALIKEMRKDAPDFEIGLAVDFLRRVATEAIHRAFSFPEQDPPLTFYYLENPEHVNLIGQLHAAIGLKGDPDNPQFEDVVMPQVDVIMTDPLTKKEEVFRAGGSDQTVQAQKGKS